MKVCVENIYIFFFYFNGETVGLSMIATVASVHGIIYEEKMNVDVLLFIRNLLTTRSSRSSIPREY